MTALELLSLVNQVLFVALFAWASWRAARQPSRSNLNAALLFGGVGAAVLGSVYSDLIGFDAPWLPGLLIAFLNVCPWAMLRLVEDFRGSPPWVQYGGTAAFVGISILSLAAFETAPLVVELATIIWFLVVGGYAAIAFATASRTGRGLTRWRMAAVAAGAYLFIITIVVVFAGTLLEAIEPITDPLAQVLALLSVVAFFVGFLPPAWLRRAWREPDLRSFLERSLHLSGVPDDRELVLEMQRAAADAVGASGAALGLADPEGRTLRYLRSDGAWVEYPADAFIAGRAFIRQQRLIITDAPEADPEHAEVYEDASARVVIAVPVTAADRRLGVLTMYGERAPIFVDDDLWLVSCTRIDNS